jgi:hypothetical protein
VTGCANEDGDDGAARAMPVQGAKLWAIRVRATRRGEDSQEFVRLLVLVSIPDGRSL